MNNSSRIRDEWNDFARAVLPKDVSKIQRQEMRRAFFAGAALVLEIAYGIGSYEVSEDQGVVILESLHEECRRFAEGIKQGVN